MHAAKKQRDELLEFIRRLAEDDKDGVMANKVLDMLWTLAKRDDCPPDTLDHALNAHIKILDFSCAQVCVCVCVLVCVCVCVCVCVFVHV